MYCPSLLIEFLDFLLLEGKDWNMQQTKIMTNEERRKKLRAIREHFVSLGLMKSRTYEEANRETTTTTTNKEIREEVKNEGIDNW